MFGLAAQLLQQPRPGLRVAQGIHHRQPFKGILAVEHPWLVQVAGLSVQDAPAKAPVDGCAAHQHGQLQPAALQLVDDQRHLLGSVDQQCAQANGICPGLCRLRDDRFGGYLLAHVDHGVAIIGQDGLDQVLTDIVHIAVHRRQHHQSLGSAFFSLQVLLQVSDGLLHYLGRLQHERQDQLASPKLIPHLFHRRQQNGVERLDRRVVARGAVQDDLVNIRLHAILVAVQDAPVQALLRRHLDGWVYRRGGFCLRAERIEVCNVALQRIWAAVEDQIFGQLALLIGDIGIRRDVRRVDNGHIQPGLHRVVQHHRVKHGPGMRGQSKRQIAHPQRGQHARQLALDQADALDRLDCRGSKFWVTGCQCEGQRIIYQRIGAQAMLVHGNIVDAARHLQLLIGDLGHAALINRQHDHRRVVLLGQRKNLIRLAAPALQVRRVDHAAAGSGFQRRLQYIHLGGVDHQRRLYASRQLLDHPPHQLKLIRPFGHRGRNIQRVRPILHLLAANLQDGIVIFSQQQPLELLTALGVAALANQQRRRLLVHRNGPCRRGELRQRLRRALWGRAFVQLLHQPLQVGGGGAAAAAHHADVVLFHKFNQRIRKRLRPQRIDRFAIHVQRQPGVRDAGNGQRGILAQVADWLAHVFGAGRAVQADHVNGQPFQDRQRSANIGAKQHAPGCIQGHLRLHRQPGFGFVKGALNAGDDGLDLQDILRSLDQQQVHPAGDQAGGLLAKHIHQFLERDVGQLWIICRGQLARRAD